MSQPRARSSDRTASDSIPSATTVTPSWWARSTVVRTIVRKLALLTIGRTRDRSSLSSSIGQPPRLSSEAYPVPKSSRDTRTPDSASSAKNLALADAVPVSSLTSSVSIRPGTCAWLSSWATAAGKSGSVTQLGTDVDRDRDGPSGRDPGAVLRQRLLQHQPG